MRSSDPACSGPTWAASVDILVQGSLARAGHGWQVMAAGSSASSWPAGSSASSWPSGSSARQLATARASIARARMASSGSWLWHSSTTRCGRRICWSPTASGSSAKALAARGAGLVACEMWEAKLEPDVINHGIGRARRRPGRRWHIGAIFLSSSSPISRGGSHSCNSNMELLRRAASAPLMKPLRCAASFEHSKVAKTAFAARCCRSSFRCQNGLRGNGSSGPPSRQR